VVSLAGARGAVTLATILSIPLLLDNGTAFPERDLLITISTGVILCSLFLASFILPLFIEKSEDSGQPGKEADVYIEILQNVIHALQAQLTPENKAAVERVTAGYYRRCMDLRQTQGWTAAQLESERKIRSMMIEWEKENTLSLLEGGMVDEYSANLYFELLDNISSRLNKDKGGLVKRASRFTGRVKDMLLNRPAKNQNADSREYLITLKTRNDAHVLEKLRGMDSDQEREIVNKLILEQEVSQSFRHGGQNSRSGPRRKKCLLTSWMRPCSAASSLNAIISN
jgi:CPA1 family monovalent cation:H+ antiporter